MTTDIDRDHRPMDSPPRIWSDRFRISLPTESDMRNDSFSTRNPTMTHLDAIAVDAEVSDQLETATCMSRAANPVLAIHALLNRLGDLHGAPAFTIEAPTIGATVREVLDNDMALQRHTRPRLNAAAEAAAAAHDATSRNLIEQILADEEQHLSWLETEIELRARLGDAVYIASRLQAVTT